MQQKLFRVERMRIDRHAGAPEHRHVVDELKALRVLAERRDSGAADAVQSLQRELALMRDSIARNTRELNRLIDDGKGRHLARAADELRASVDGMDHATQKILASVEFVEDGARSLASSLKHDYERGLAQDILEHVVQIYEACNFQDLAGQRISNVIGIMTAVEDQIAAMIERSNTATGATPASAEVVSAYGLLNGPKLDGDDGHASQRDIDKMFD